MKNLTVRALRAPVMSTRNPETAAKYERFVEEGEKLEGVPDEHRFMIARVLILPGVKTDPENGHKTMQLLHHADPRRKWHLVIQARRVLHRDNIRRILLLQNLANIGWMPVRDAIHQWKHKAKIKSNIKKQIDFFLQYQGNQSYKRLFMDRELFASFVGLLDTEQHETDESKVLEPGHSSEVLEARQEWKQFDVPEELIKQAKELQRSKKKAKELQRSKKRKRSQTQPVYPYHLTCITVSKAWLMHSPETKTWKIATIQCLRFLQMICKVKRLRTLFCDCDICTRCKITSYY